MSKSNQTSLVADLLQIAQASTEVETGCIFLCHAHWAEIGALVHKLNNKAADEKTRTIIVNYWHESSADGEKFMREFDALKSTEKRTAAQDTRFATMQKQQNAANTALERAAKTYNGIAYLKKRAMTVTIAEDKKSKGTYVCYAQAKDEEDRVAFNASQLMKIETCIPLLDNETSALDVRSKLKSLKQGTPNENKGNAGERIAPSKIADVVTNLDTSLAAIAKDGGGFAVGPDAQARLRALWVQLDTTLSDADKQLARDEHAKLAAEPEKQTKPVANIVSKVKTVIAGK